MIGLNDLAFDQVLGVFLPGGLHVTNSFVHHWLGSSRFICLVVPELAIADQVDDHVAFESLAEVTGNFHDMVNRLRIIGIHVKDGRMHHLGDRGAIQC